MPFFNNNKLVKSREKGQVYPYTASEMGGSELTHWSESQFPSESSRSVTYSEGMRLSLPSYDQTQEKGDLVRHYDFNHPTNPSEVLSLTESDSSLAASVEGPVEFGVDGALGRRAAHFNGEDTTVEEPAGFALSHGKEIYRTYLATVQVSRLGREMHFLGHGEFSGTGAPGYAIGVRRGQWIVRLSDSTLIEFGTAEKGVHQVAVRYGSDTIGQPKHEFWVDGTLLDSVVHEVTNAVDTPMIIGSSVPRSKSTDSVWKGFIDQILVYHTFISREDIEIIGSSLEFGSLTSTKHTLGE